MMFFVFWVEARWKPRWPRWLKIVINCEPNETSQPHHTPRPGEAIAGAGDGAGLAKREAVAARGKPEIYGLLLVAK